MVFHSGGDDTIGELLTTTKCFVPVVVEWFLLAKYFRVGCVKMSRSYRRRRDSMENLGELKERKPFACLILTLTHVSRRLKETFISYFGYINVLKEQEIKLQYFSLPWRKEVTEKGTILTSL